jgi:SPOR domain
VRWILIVLLMCNGIYFLWQNYLLQSEEVVLAGSAAMITPDAQSLLLLSELSAEQLQGSSEVSVIRKKNTAVVVEKAPGVCWLIGPFKEEVSAKQVVSRLAALDITLQLTEIDIYGKPDHWVHIAPQATRKDALKLLRELQAKKIDSFLITTGDLANGISLGLFSSQSRAEMVYEQRVEQGYSAEVKVVPRVHSELWVIFSGEKYGKFSDTLWDKIRLGNKGLERRKNYCDKIASADDFD